MSYRIHVDENAPQAIRRMVREQLERALEAAAALGGPGEAKAAHAIRKRIKKIRALLRLVRKLMDADVYREENRRLRTAAHGFSRLRDANVQMEVVEKLRRSTGLAPAAFAETMAVLRRKAESAGEHRDAIAALEGLGDRLEGWPLPEVTIEALCRAWQRTYGEARTCLHHVLDHRTTENFHAWRKRTKNVWYQARILQELNPPVICEISAAAENLGEHLGDLHDLAFLREELAAGTPFPAAEAEVLIGLIGREEKALEQIALDLGSRFFAEQAGAFGRRLRRYASERPPSA